MSACQPWVQYTFLRPRCKPRPGVGALAAGLCLLLALPLAAGELDIASGPGRAGAVAWEALEMNYRIGDAQGGAWRAMIGPLRVHDVRIADRFELDCRPGPAVAVKWSCRQGRLDWIGPDGAWQWSGEIEVGAVAGARTVRLEGDAFSVHLRLPENERPLSARLVLDNLALEHVPAAWRTAAGLAELAGRVSGRLRFEGSALDLDLNVVEGAFDSTDGMWAAGGLGLQLIAGVELGGEVPEWRARVRQHAGEWLLTSIYLPPAEASLEMSVSGRGPDAGRMVIERFEFADPGALSVAGSGRLEHGDEGWAISRVELDEMAADFPAAWNRWADGPLAAAGYGGLQTRGSASGRLVWTKEGPQELVVQGESIDVEDPAGRFALESLEIDLRFGQGKLEAGADWQGMSLWKLPLGGSRLRAAGGDRGLELTEPLRLPLLDGAIVFEELRWRDDDDGQPELALDARIEPLELAGLTRTLDFPEFGGTLSGRFPGVVYASEQLHFTGGIEVEAFSGRIGLDQLSIERPFGSLPALAAQVEINRLDLAELTSAFNFGHMEGRLSGWLRDLRLLDWQPVAMDTRLFTHEDAPRRRISQRAVQNLSRLGGAGGALLTGTILRVFEEFPYRRAGLACRLANNICHIDGVAPHESGGFYILEGRSLPRLDVIGHRRLVDWPQMVAQLAAIIENR